MKRLLLPTLGLAAASLLWAGLSLVPRSPEGGALTIRPVPEFPTQDPNLWINSSPLEVSDLKGRVVLLDVWTFG